MQKIHVIHVKACRELKAPLLILDLGYRRSQDFDRWRPEEQAKGMAERRRPEVLTGSHSKNGRPHTTNHSPRPEYHRPQTSTPQKHPVSIIHSTLTRPHEIVNFLLVERTASHPEDRGYGELVTSLTFL